MIANLGGGLEETLKNATHKQTFGHSSLPWYYACDHQSACDVKEVCSVRVDA